MYTISYPSGTIRNEGVVVPQDITNAAYQAYESWLQAGNGPVAISDQEPEPTRQHITVTAWQLRKALIAQGMYEHVQSSVQSYGDMNLITGWEYATEFESDHPMLLAMLPALGLDEDQMYALFEQAKGL